MHKNAPPPGMISSLHTDWIPFPVLQTIPTLSVSILPAATYKSNKKSRGLNHYY
jgi:hypothetical protein